MSSIDTSIIDETKPQVGSATTASVRENFAAIKAQLAVAKEEMEALDAGKADTSSLGALAVADEVTDAAVSTSSKLYNRINDTASVVDYLPFAELAAIHAGTSSYDCTAAFQAALDAGASKVIVPAGDYVVSALLSVPAGKAVKGYGPGSTIIKATGLGGTVGLFDVDDPTAAGLLTEISGMTIAATDANAMFGIRTPQGAALTLDFKPRYKFSNLLFRGGAGVVGGSDWEQDFGFAAGIRLGDCMSADLRDIQIWGTFDMDADPALSPDHTGIYLDGLQSLRNVVIDNYLTSDVKYPLDLGENNTSVYLSNVDCARGWYGIRTLATGSNGEFFGTGCTFNAQRIGVELKNRSWCVLQGVHATRHELSYDHAEEWHGFDLTNVNDAFVSNCRALHPGTWTSVGNRVGFNLDDVLYGKFSNVLVSSAGSLMECGFKLLNNSADMLFDNIVFDDVATWWDFGAGTFDISIGNVSHRGSVTTKYAFDASITTTAINNTFKISGFNGRAETYDAAHESIHSFKRATGQEWQLKQATNDDLVIRDVTNTANKLTLSSVSGTISTAGPVRAVPDNTYSLGQASFRWSEVFAGAGAINTSDAREKQQVRPLDEAERAVAGRLKGMIKAFKFNEAVARKGDAARIHVGVLAQELIEAFAAEGLDAHRYALLCFDEWEAQPELVDAQDGAVIQPAIAAGNRYGVRYDELLAFVLAAI